MRLCAYEPVMQPDIRAFCAACFAALGWEYEPQGRHGDTENIANIYQKSGQFWCLYDEEKLIGTVAVRGLNPEVAELKRLYVLPERQGEGLGRLLFETALEYAKGQGFRIIRADTQVGRAASRHLMQSHGFREIPRYNQNDFAELFYELELPG